LCFQTTPLGGGEGTAFNFGIATRGTVSLIGSAQIRGLNASWEADMYIGSPGPDPVLWMDGRAVTDGDVVVAYADANLQESVSHRSSIGGESMPNRDDPEAGIWDHLHLGGFPVVFPEASTTDFEAYAKNVVDKDTPTDGGTFTNIRILADTDPTFSGGPRFEGVIFIETPNKVTISGGAEIAAIIVTQDAGSGATESNYIHLTGGVSVLGVDTLPDEPQFEGLHDEIGTFIVAPGFEVLLDGSFGTVSGAMAAEQFSFTGDAGGTLRGPLINWGSGQLGLDGNSSVIIDRSLGTDMLPGFDYGDEEYYRLKVLKASYREPTE